MTGRSTHSSLRQRSHRTFERAGLRIPRARDADSASSHFLISPEQGRVFDFGAELHLKFDTFRLSYAPTVHIYPQLQVLPSPKFTRFGVEYDGDYDFHTDYTATVDGRFTVPVTEYTVGQWDWRASRC